MSAQPEAPAGGQNPGRSRRAGRGPRVHRGLADRALSGCHQRPFPGRGQDWYPHLSLPLPPGVGPLRAASQASSFLRTTTAREGGGWGCCRALGDYVPGTELTQLSAGSSGHQPPSYRGTGGSGTWLLTVLGFSAPPKVMPAWQAQDNGGARSPDNPPRGSRHGAEPGQARAHAGLTLQPGPAWTSAEVQSFSLAKGGGQPSSPERDCHDQEGLGAGRGLWARKGAPALPAGLTAPWTACLVEPLTHAPLLGPRDYPRRYVLLLSSLFCQ